MKGGLVLLLMAAQTLGGTEVPVASLVSLGPVQFNSVRLWAESVYFWPVLPEDEVLTEATAATVFFSDRSRITLDRNTRVKFSSRGGTPTVTLLTGQMGYLLVPGSALRIAASGNTLPPAERSGILSLHSGKAAIHPGRSTLPGTPDPPPGQLPSLGMYLPTR